MLSIIAARRDGRPHSEQDLHFLAQGAAKSSIPDYQLSAWLMAEYLKPLTEQETVWLTKAMAASGGRIDLTGLPHPWVDKHSTGGVGDKTTLVVLPILAACGLTVVKMSGRGLGITGGTVDKLESIPGFRMDLTPEDMKEQAARIGIAITGQSADLAPADKTLYALRDATATTESIPLIASSILSKKIAGGAEYLSLDVKCGSGAFMKTFDKAKDLATWLKRIGEQCGLNVHAMITDMDQPLGGAVGNALEVREALQVLSNHELEPPVARFRQLCIELSGATLHFAGKASSSEDGTVQAEAALLSGSAVGKCKEWFVAQGAGGTVVDSSGTDLLIGSKPKQSLFAQVDGYLAHLDAGIIGEGVVNLGGGRRTKSDRIDPTVGVVVHKIVGDKVAAHEPIMTVYGDKGFGKEAVQSLAAAIQISGEPLASRPIILETL